MTRVMFLCDLSPRSGRHPVARGEPAVGKHVAGRMDKPRRGDIRLHSQVVEYDRR